MMAASSVGSNSGGRIAGDEIDVVSPVFDGNEVKIVVPFEMTTGGRGNDGVHEKKVRVEIPVPRTDHAQLLLQNHRNFKESGNPVMFMKYKDGSWRNFEKSAVDVLVSAFVDRKGFVEVETEGGKFIFDFYRMIGNDLESGSELPISWVDIGGKFFYPKISENDKIELEIKITEKREELGKRKREEVDVGSSSRTVKEQHPLVSAPTQLLPLPPKWPKTRSLREEESTYEKVKRLLLFGLRTVAVTAVHECIITNPMEQDFARNVEILGRATENPRVEYAWHGTSSKNLERIMRHGFDVPRIVPGSHPYGVGIYLSPLCSPQNSEMMCEIDENGEKHIMMCRVILGNLERVELGSQQRFPGPHFDTGVDELINPKRYVVWCENMNTHILPEFIVSYKPGCNVSGRRLDGDVFARNALFILKIQSSLPLPTKLEFEALFTSYQEGKVGDEFFMRQLQSLVGDELLHSLIQEFRG